jgi:uracil-DNA glycosylase
MEKINPVIEESWKEILEDEFNKSYFTELKQFLLLEKKKFRVYPPGPLIFNAFNHTPFQKVKVVLIGQDPYHGSGQAHGLCFSVPDGIPKPPSLVNIFIELEADTGIPQPAHGNLEKWADQGVLLLNATLTERANQAGSHQNKGWEIFTDAVITRLSELRHGLIFILWGNFAIAKQNLVDSSKHVILTAAHPSPFSANKGFFGCRHFSKVNEILKSAGQEEIDWRL